MVYTSTEWVFKNFKQLEFKTDACYSCKKYSKAHSTDDIVAMDESVDAAQYSWAGMCVNSMREAAASVPDSHDVKW